MAHAHSITQIARTLRRSIVRLLAHEGNRLVPFAMIVPCLHLGSQHSLGLRSVPIAQITGSVGRTADFDRHFRPRLTETHGRLLSINEALNRGLTLPPVELYKVGDVYFVVDGNHRISALRARGQEFVDAHVIEIDAPVPVTPDTIVERLCGCAI